MVPARALLQRQARLGAVERLDLALLVDARAPAPCPAGRDRGRRCPAPSRTKCLSLDSLKVFTRCGFSSCAAQMRCTLVWLSPTARAMLADAPVRALPAASRARSSATTRAITAADSGGLRPGRLASRRNPSMPCASVALLPAADRPLALADGAHDRLVPQPSADISTMRARQTSFCGVLRSATQPSSVARSPGDSQMHDSLAMPSDSHAAEPKGILPLETEH